MKSREINKLKKMRENIIRSHRSTTPRSINARDRFSRDYSRVIEIDRQLKNLK